ncbi:MAG: long-chain fatty acid--CoA ligase [Thermodesulfobacteriota bacterium]
MSVGMILRRNAENMGEKEGIVFEDTRYTYGEFNSRVNQLADAVHGLGLKKGDRAAILHFNCSQYLEIYFAMAKLGICLVTLNYRLIDKELEYILNDSKPIILFLGEEFFETVSSIRNRCPYIQFHILIENHRSSGMMDYETLLNNGFDQEPEAGVGLEDDQLIIYTSGTTGYPKGALVSHSNTLWTCFNQLLLFRDLKEGDSTLVVSPLYHCGAQNDFTLPVLQLGGKIVIMRRVDPEKIVEIIQEEKITTALLLPTLLHMIFQLPTLYDYDLSSLRYVMTGGAPLPDVTIENFHRRMGYHINQVFGLTEGTALSTILSPEDASRKKGSAGKPLFYVDLKIVDDQGKEVKPGEVGELIQKGPTVMKGYWNNPKATAETIKEGWLYTGDLAWVDEEGFTYIVDRKKDMIISGEENIYPAEIEQVLYSHPKIQEAAVIGVPDEKWGESVKAVVVCKEGEHLTEEEVIHFAKQHLAGFKKPKLVEFVDQLPRNASLKVLKRVLRENHAKQG